MTIAKESLSRNLFILKRIFIKKFIDTMLCLGIIQFNYYVFIYYVEYKLQHELLQGNSRIDLSYITLLSSDQSISIKYFQYVQTVHPLGNQLL